MMSRSGGTLLLSLLIALIISTLFSVNQPIAQREEKVDCLFMLSLLDKTLGLALNRDERGELYARIMLEASNIPLDLRDRHRDTYEAILKYIELITGDLDQLTVVTTAYTMLSRINTMREYAERLSACSVNREAANALRVSVVLKLADLENNVNRIVEIYSYSTLSIIDLAEQYSARDVINIPVEKDLYVDEIEMFSWPSLIEIKRYTFIELNETHVLFTVYMPTAREIEELGLKPTYKGEVHVALYARFENNSYVLIGLTKIVYSKPKIAIEFPTIIKRGQDLYVVLRAEDQYNVMLFFNDKSVINTTTYDVYNEIKIDYSEYNYTKGLNKIKICVEPSVDTYSYCIENPVVIEPNYPKVRVGSTSTYISWLGGLQLVVSNEDTVSTLVVVESNFDKKTLSLPEGRSSYIELPVGILPVFILNYRITIIPSSDSYDVLILDNQVLVINVLSIFVFLLISTILIPVVSDRERGFVLFIASTWRAIIKPLEEMRREKSPEIFQPYELGLGSSIALMFYGLLRKLKIRLPALHETLREHYENISGSLSNSVKPILWKLLLLVERDLYSSRKPSIRNAEILYYGVLDAATED